jgi:uncharacterized membrane protein (UPF0127 family)
MPEQKPFFFSRNKKKISIFFSFFLLSLMLFCAASSSRKYVKVFLPNGFSLTAELAVTDQERQLGLMFRDKINWDQGMLLVFKREGIYHIWMKNMRFSIDILWLDREKRIVHIETNVPPCRKEPCPSYAHSNPALFVLELKAGKVNKQQLKLYDKLEFILPKIKQDN